MGGGEVNHSLFLRYIGIPVKSLAILLGYRLNFFEHFYSYWFNSKCWRYVKRIHLSLRVHPTNCSIGSIKMDPNAKGFFCLSEQSQSLGMRTHIYSVGIPGICLEGLEKVNKYSNTFKPSRYNKTMKKTLHTQLVDLCGFIWILWIEFKFPVHDLSHRSIPSILQHFQNPCPPRFRDFFGSNRTPNQNQPAR